MGLYEGRENSRIENEKDMPKLNSNLERGASNCQFNKTPKEALLDMEVGQTTTKIQTKTSTEETKGNMETGAIENRGTHLSNSFEALDSLLDDQILEDFNPQ